MEKRLITAPCPAPPWEKCSCGSFSRGSHPTCLHPGSQWYFQGWEAHPVAMPGNPLVFCSICTLTLQLEINPTVTRNNESSSPGRRAPPNLRECHDTDKNKALPPPNVYHSCCHVHFTIHRPHKPPAIRKETGQFQPWSWGCQHPKVNEGQACFQGLSDHECVTSNATWEEF